MADIPKKIFYVWDGDKPNFVQSCIVSWKINNPDYEIIELNNDHPLYQKVSQENEFFQYCAKRNIFAPMSDILRLEALYEYGGVYMDIDIQLLKSLDSIIHQNFLGIEIKDSVNGAIMGFEPKHPLIKRLRDYYRNEVMQSEKFIIPQVITMFLKEVYNENEFLPDKKYEYSDLTVYPKEYFYPYYYTEKFDMNCVTQNTYSIHWWKSSWSDKSSYEYLKYRKEIHATKTILPAALTKFLSLFIFDSQKRKTFRRKYTRIK